MTIPTLRVDPEQDAAMARLREKTFIGYGDADLEMLGDAAFHELLQEGLVEDPGEGYRWKTLEELQADARYGAAGELLAPFRSRS